MKDWRDEWRELKPDGEGLSRHHPANYRDSESLQDAVHFLNGWLEGKLDNRRIPNLALKNLFTSYMPNHMHILDALTRSSGRPPKGAMTKQQAVDYIQYLISPPKDEKTGERKKLSGEEMLLYAVLLKYQKPHQGNGIDQYWKHRLMEQFMRNNPDYADNPTRAAHALAKQLNKGAAEGVTWHKINLLDSYLKVIKKQQAQQ